MGAGTPAYMAPEQWADQEVTVQSDLYVLGLVLYELFTGQAVYSGKTPASRPQ
jgi:serine/threonine protein kinase